MKTIIQLCSLFLMAAGCSQPPPEISGAAILEMNPSGIAPLAGLLTFTTDQPARATLRISDTAGNELTVTPFDEFLTDHELMLLGLRPDRSNQIEVFLENPAGGMRSAMTFDARTPPMPSRMPEIQVTVSHPELMEPGITLQPVFSDGSPEDGFIVGLDAAGKVVWFLDDLFDEPRRLQNGNLFGNPDSNERKTLQEIDMLGRVVREWHATGIDGNTPDGTIPVDTDTFHHDSLEMPSGNFLVLSSEIRHLESFRSSRRDGAVAGPFPRDIIGDRLIEFSPQDGTIVRDWKITDLIDSSRVARGAMNTNFYESAYDEILDDPLSDWSHANGIWYDEATDTAIVSIRKQSAIVKIDLAANELLWILGEPTGWAPEFTDLLLEPIGELEWTYGQHAPQITPTGTLLVYDNGSGGRAHPPNQGLPMSETYSRAVEYEIDEANGTVRQIWSYGGPGSEHFYSDFVSEADPMPITGNVLLTNGGQLVTEDGQQTQNQGAGRVWLSVMEVTHAMPAKKVWEIVIDTPTGEWGAYRSERVPSLYP